VRTGKQRTLQAGTSEIRTLQVRTCKQHPLQLGTSEVRLAEVGVTKIQWEWSCDVRRRLGGTGVANHGLHAVRDLHLLQIGPREVRRTEVGVTKIRRM
jgi:hypothetical protein